MKRFMIDSEHIQDGGVSQEFTKLQTAESKYNGLSKIQSKRVIVIIDRDPFQREALKQQLQSVGFEDDIFAYGCVKDAISYLNQASDAESPGLFRSSLIFLTHYQGQDGLTNTRSALMALLNPENSIRDQSNSYQK